MPVTPRVLLVTESNDEREMYAESFRRRGFCTLLASTAADAARLASELPPAAVITDAHLAGDEDGLTLARRFKGDDFLRGVPLVLLTPHVFNHDRDAAARAGCDLFVPKPCLPDVLTGLVAGLIQRHTSVRLSESA
jgi:two-component system, OmpR family, phosphate regulon response regulator PhoB